MRWLERQTAWWPRRTKRGLEQLCPSVALLTLFGCLLGCATQREQRISAAEARDRPSDEPCEPRGRPPKPGAVWACGYWHWDSVRYVWIEGNWREP